MHIKAMDIDKFSAIKVVACCALCEPLNNKVLPVIGHWENLSGLYISWCLLSVLFYLRCFTCLWYFRSNSLIFRTKSLFKRC